MAEYRRTVGNVELVSLTDDHGGGPATGVFPTSTMEVWRAEFPELLDADEYIHPRYGSVAVRSDGKLVVVDTGGGPPAGALLSEMGRKGVDREAVDLVVTTHLHPDHVGWNLTDGQANIPQRQVPGAQDGLGLLDRSGRPGGVPARTRQRDAHR